MSAVRRWWVRKARMHDHRGVSCGVQVEVVEAAAYEALQRDLATVQGERYKAALESIAKRAVVEARAEVAENPYSDAVEALGNDEPSTVGRKIAGAIRREVGT